MGRFEFLREAPESADPFAPALDDAVLLLIGWTNGVRLAKQEEGKKIERDGGDHYEKQNQGGGDKRFEDGRRRNKFLIRKGEEILVLT